MRKSPFERLEELYLRVFDTDFMRRIVRNSSYLVSATVVVAGIGFFQAGFQYRALGPADVGLFGVLATFTNVLNRLTAFRIDEMVVRYVRLYTERGQHDRAAATYKLAALLESLGALAAFALILWLAPLGVQIFSDQPNTEHWFILYGTLVLINIFYDSSDGLLQVFDRFDAKSVIDVAQGLLRFGLTVLVFFTGGGLREFILAELAGRLLRAGGIMIVALYTARKRWGSGWWRTPFNVLREDRRSLLTFAFSTNASATISLVAKDSEGLWVNAFLGNVAGGFYTTALGLIGLLQIPISPLPSTTYPELSRAVANNNWANVRHVLRRGSMLASAYSLPVMLGILFFGRQIITLWVGAEFIPAYAPLVVLVLGYTFVNILYWNRAALLAFNRPVYPTIVNFIGMLIKVAIIFAVGANLGAVGFATLLAGYYIFTVGLAALRVRRDVREHLAAPA